MIKRVARIALGACLLASAIHADTVHCENGLITVKAPSTAIARTVCENADASIAHFAACGLGSPPLQTVEIRETLDANCIGLFHCGEDRIEILSPSGLDAVRDGLELFGHIPTDRLFASVLHHELSHALYETRPCPFQSCIATSEYFAYTQQIAALVPEDRATIVARINPQVTRHRDMINAMILFMAPDRFVLASWAHFTDRPNACAYWTGLLDGATHFDQEHP